jgi:hypothetical protein
MSQWMISPDLADAYIALSYHMYQFYSCQDCLRSPKRFGSQHSSAPSFDISMILLNQIVQVLALSDGYPFFFWFVGIECGQGHSIRKTFIDSHHLGLTVMMNSLAKKAPSRCSIPLGPQQEVDGLIGCIYRALV